MGPSFKEIHQMQEGMQEGRTKGSFLSLISMLFRHEQMMYFKQNFQNISSNHVFIRTFTKEVMFSHFQAWPREATIDLDPGADPRMYSNKFLTL